MSKVPYLVVRQHEARDICPDQPVILLWVLGTNNTVYMRYHGEFHKIDRGSYVSSSKHKQRWCIAGVWFTDDSAAWMANNAVAYPFSPEDLVLYQLTCDLCCE